MLLQRTALSLLCLASLLAGSIQHQTRIVGGKTAEPGQFPFMVSIRFPSAQDHFCGGSIIADQWIVTAAHCVDAIQENNEHTGLDINPVLAVGNINLDVSGRLYNTSRSLLHPEYNRTSLINDIALIQTSQKIIFDDTTQPTTISDIGVNISCTVSGWGQYEEEEHYSDKLLFLDVSTISLEECRERWHQTNYSYIGERSVCSDSPDGTGFCIGDSGGPLTVEGKLVGIVSFNVPCAENRDVYTRVASFVTWIDETITRFTV